MLTRMPRGFDPDHPAGDVAAVSVVHGRARRWRWTDIQSAKLPDVLAKHYAAMTPFIRWLNTALGTAEARSEDGERAGTD